MCAHISIANRGGISMVEKNLFKERGELFTNAIQMKKNKRTPLLANFFTWKILDSEYTLTEALQSYDIMEKVVCDFHERYQFDTYFDLGTRNPIRVTDALGAGYHKIDEPNESIFVVDHSIMERDEYLELAKDPLAFNWSKAFARYAPDLTIAQLQNAALEFAAFGEFGQKMNDKFLNEYQCKLMSPYISLLPFEQFFNTYRGIKELAIDLRKCKAEMIEAMETLYQTAVLPAMQGAVTADTSPFFSDAMTAFLGHSILSVKQFGELYWPYLKRILDLLTANKKTMFIMCESTMMRFTDFFRDLPSGTLMIQIEQDNIFELRDNLPNVCLAGGMTTDLLGHGTPRQCIDYAKKLIDELGEGYVFSTNKMMSYRNDSKRENLLAVTDFVRNYRL